MRVMLWVLVLCVGCGDDGGARDAGAGEQDASMRDAGPLDAGGDAGETSRDGGADAFITDSGTERDDGGPTDAGPLDLGPPDLGPPGPVTYDVRVLADGFCDELSFDPPSIRVPAGSAFTVRWINATGCTEVDIDKDGNVPIVIGLEPGGSYHDTVREWCGLFTGTFVFRAYYSATYPFVLPVDCDG